MMNIAVIGNSVYDITVKGSEPLREGGKNSFYDATFNTGGPASNAASVIAKGKLDVDFYGQIGRDQLGAVVFKQMQEEGINLDHLRISDTVSTPFSFIIINTETGDRTINSVRPIQDYQNAKIEGINFGNNYDYILTDGKYAEDTEMLIENNPQAISIIDAGRYSKKILNLCKKINYIICSEEFANAVTNNTLGISPERNAEIFNELQSMYPQAKIAITVGKRGYICERDGMVINMPAYEPEMKTIDTNGAGDIFHGAFTYAMATGHDYYESLEFANITAALSTTKHGGRESCPDLQYVEQILNGQRRIRGYCC